MERHRYIHIRGRNLNGVGDPTGREGVSLADIFYERSENWVLYADTLRVYPSYTLLK